jgi:predicted Zn-dependent peptidase
MDCYNTFYHPENLILAIAGDINKENVLAEVDRYFPGRSNLNLGKMPIEEPDAAGQRYVEKAMLVSKPIFHLGFKDNDTDVEGFALSKKEMEIEILLEYLFGKSSPFYDELYQSGIINGEFDCWYDLSDYFSFCVINGESNEPKRVEETAWAHIDRLLAEGIDDERFIAIRNGLYGSLIIDTEQSYGMANRMIANSMNGAETFDAIDAIHTITKEDLLARAKKIFAKERSCLSVIYPIKEDE